MLHFCCLCFIQVLIQLYRVGLHPFPPQKYIFFYIILIYDHTDWHFLLLQAALLACFLSNTFPFFLLRLHWTDVSSTNYIQKLKGDCIEVTFTEGTVIIGSMFCLVIFNFAGFFFFWAFEGMSPWMHSVKTCHSDNASCQHIYYPWRLKRVRGVDVSVRVLSHCSPTKCLHIHH